MNTEKKIDDESGLQSRDSTPSSTDDKQGFWSSFKDSFKPPLDEKKPQTIDSDIDERTPLTDVQKINIRSEERRVGKECRL